jgi:DeoR family glycerol-3-phosphate regulon repressor
MQAPASQEERPREVRRRMLPQLRHAHILSELATKGAIQVSMVAQELGVSDMTVRRDLMELESAGKLTRTFGGALDISSARQTAVDHHEPQFDARMRRHRDAKEAIAARAAALAIGCRTIALDVGTTTHLLARQLAMQPEAKLFTNSLRIAAELAADVPEIYVPGGRVRASELAIGGSAAVSQFQSLWFDIAFIGVSGITPSGLFDYSFEDVELKRVYLSRSGLGVVLCDASKFMRMSLVHVATLSAFGVLVTDAPPPHPLADALAEAGVRIEIASPTANP